MSDIRFLLERQRGSGPVHRRQEKALRVRGTRLGLGLTSLNRDQVQSIYHLHSGQNGSSEEPLRTGRDPQSPTIQSTLTRALDVRPFFLRGCQCTRSSWGELFAGSALPQACTKLVWDGSAIAWRWRHSVEWVWSYVVVRKVYGDVG